MSNEFPKIQRGNGVLNDNLATLVDIILAVKMKVDDVESSIKVTGREVKQVQKIIGKINEQNTPREIQSYRLLVSSVAIASISIVISIIALFK